MFDATSHNVEPFERYSGRTNEKYSGRTNEKIEYISRHSLSLVKVRVLDECQVSSGSCLPGDKFWRWASPAIAQWHLDSDLFWVRFGVLSPPSGGCQVPRLCLSPNSAIMVSMACCSRCLGGAAWGVLVRCRRGSIRCKGVAGKLPSRAAGFVRDCPCGAAGRRGGRACWRERACCRCHARPGRTWSWQASARWSPTPSCCRPRRTPSESPSCSSDDSPLQRQHCHRKHIAQHQAHAAATFTQVMASR